MHDLAGLQAFDALCRYKSLTAAAEALSQPKSTLSRRLNQLETDLGQTLVARDGNRLQLTEAGRIYAIYCRQLLDLAARGQDALQELQEEISGKLILVVHSAFKRGWLTSVLDHFMSQHPGIRLEIRTQLLPQQAEEADLWIWLGDLPVSHYRREKLGSWVYGLYAAPGYLKQQGCPRHPQELVRHAWVDLQGLGSVVLHHTGGEEYLLSPADSRWKSDEMILQADAISQGKGIGLIPVWLAENFAKAHPGSVEPCLQQWFTEPVDIACHYTRGRPSRRLALLLAALREACPEEWKVPSCIC